MGWGRCPVHSETRTRRGGLDTDCAGFSTDYPRPKYLCKYCDIFITDDKPSRAQHENGMRHKGNKDKYIKDLYRKGAQDAKDKVDLERQLAAIGAVRLRCLDQADLSRPRPPRSTLAAPMDRSHRPRAPGHATSRLVRQKSGRAACPTTQRRRSSA